MAEITYHEAHEPYMEAVADAFDAAGLAVEDWHADANDPRDGCISLAERDADGDQRHVAWHEEQGWFYGTSAEDGHGEIRNIWWICDDVLPEPADVVAAARRCIAGDHSQATIFHGYYRHFDDESDDGFEERLLAYAGGDDG
ncbi:DUF6292 family protein [Nonomuraea sp. NPDC023979]|uniref:DUF6292 family protein n=1 Tax=Nonomuraea sp. NPDC023979 TaxID=3154796 RepID=UPI0033DE6715